MSTAQPEIPESADGRRGWRKHYVEFLDAGVPFLLSAILNVGGEALSP